MDRPHLGLRRTENQGIAGKLMDEREARSLVHIHMSVEYLPVQREGHTTAY